MPKSTAFLWFDTQAEEAARYYVSKLLSNPRATAALMQMEKIDIAALKQA